MRVGRTIAALSKFFAAAVIAVTLSGCMTSVVEAPKPLPREEPINSLALEQCVGENGPEKCAADGD